MKNGIIINGVEYRAVFHKSGVAELEGCAYCDLLNRCDFRFTPCNMFHKKGCWVNFKKVQK